MSKKLPVVTSVAANPAPAFQPGVAPDYRFSVSVGPLSEESLTAWLILRFKTPLLRPEQVQVVLARSRSLMEECVDAGWLRPCVSGNRLVVYSAADVAKCVIRITKEGRPPQGGPYLLPSNHTLPPLLG